MTIWQEGMRSRISNKFVGYSYTLDPDNGLPTTQQHAGEVYEL